MCGISCLIIRVFMQFIVFNAFLGSFPASATKEKREYVISLTCSFFIKSLLPAYTSADHSR